ncbi:MAG: alpha/beta hydrolase, partial [Gammaproteobacteria bacterium]|nr:alpha/beta hydrolase [Gammaproteobacteria bacterium]
KKYFAQKALDNAEFNSYIFKQYKADRAASLEPLLPAIRQPTLILWGDGDDVLDKSRIDVMTPLLKNETVVIMPETGHVPMAERPAETASHYLAFLGLH